MTHAPTAVIPIRSDATSTCTVISAPRFCNRVTQTRGTPRTHTASASALRRKLSTGFSRAFSCPPSIAEDSSRNWFLITAADSYFTVALATRFSAKHDYALASYCRIICTLNLFKLNFYLFINFEQLILRYIFK